MYQDIKPNLLELNKKTAKVAPRDYSAPVTQPTTSRAAHAQSAPNKRASTAAAHPVSKKPKLAAPYKDISVAEASRYGTLHDYAFFDKVTFVYIYRMVLLIEMNFYKLK